MGRSGGGVYTYHSPWGKPLRAPSLSILEMQSCQRSATCAFALPQIKGQACVFVKSKDHLPLSGPTISLNIMIRPYRDVLFDVQFPALLLPSNIMPIY